MAGPAAQSAAGRVGYTSVKLLAAATSSVNLPAPWAPLAGLSRGPPVCQAPVSRTHILGGETRVWRTAAPLA